MEAQPVATARGIAAEPLARCLLPSLSVKPRRNCRHYGDRGAPSPGRSLPSKTRSLLMLVHASTSQRGTCGMQLGSAALPLAAGEATLPYGVRRCLLGLFYSGLFFGLFVSFRAGYGWHLFRHLRPPSGPCGAAPAARPDLCGACRAPRSRRCSAAERRRLEPCGKKSGQTKHNEAAGPGVQAVAPQFSPVQIAPNSVSAAPPVEQANTTCRCRSPRSAAGAVESSNKTAHE